MDVDATVWRYQITPVERLNISADETGFCEATYFDLSTFRFYQYYDGQWRYSGESDTVFEGPEGIDPLAYELPYAVTKIRVDSVTKAVTLKRNSITELPLSTSFWGEVPEFEMPPHTVSYDESTGLLQAAMNEHPDYPALKYTMKVATNDWNEYELEYAADTGCYQLDLAALGLAYADLNQLVAHSTCYAVRLCDEDGGEYEMTYSPENRIYTLAMPEYWTENSIACVLADGMIFECGNAHVRQSAYDGGVMSDTVHLDEVHVATETGDWFFSHAGNWEYGGRQHLVTRVDDGRQNVAATFVFDESGRMTNYSFLTDSGVTAHCDGTSIYQVFCDANGICQWTASENRWPKLDFATGQWVDCDMPEGLGLETLAPLFGEPIFQEPDLIVTTLPADLTVIEAEAFANTDLQAVVIPAGVTSIGSRAFAGCANLTKLTIPASVTSIAEDAITDTALDTIIAPEGSYAADWAEAHGPFVRHQ